MSDPLLRVPMTKICTLVVIGVIVATLAILGTLHRLWPEVFGLSLISFGGAMAGSGTVLMGIKVLRKTR